LAYQRRKLVFSVDFSLFSIFFFSEGKKSLADDIFDKNLFMEKDTKGKTMLGYFYILFFISLLAFNLAYRLYKVTAISWVHILIIVIGIGIIASQVSGKQMELFYENYIPSFKWYMVANTATWGLIGFAVFMSINYYLAKAETQRQETFEIVSRRISYSSTNTSARRQVPKFKINYHGLKKEISFRSNVANSIDAYDSVNLDIQDGALGYHIFKHTSLNVKPRD